MSIIEIIKRQPNPKNVELTKINLIKELTDFELTKNNDARKKAAKLLGQIFKYYQIIVKLEGKNEVSYFDTINILVVNERGYLKNLNKIISYLNES